MSKAYSNKALPAGTVLREWRLEQVLGVGGFGIVYKGRGIYFDELVAIKEYFPSSISERDADDTVVPIDSDAEEVHALGLKKFVEEAKLLWNLSTPSRHPNIVSVRSLFEIHGTAYMVMDFEDGMSLSRLLKEGKRFNEASLLGLVKPIAEGLDRAHRVGVLHRDIKPPNILINDDGRPVLIDFGSARFESGEATSTSVTFHTPPYAAIEQYVKTYTQGPWTDIYALGVVLYQCVTGEKPPEVLERMHGGDAKPLSEGNWPGYSKAFLAAIDAAMTVKPAERPQSIPEWLALLDGADTKPAPVIPMDDFDDEDATRIEAFTSEDIVPVAPPPPGFKAGETPPTAVPDDVEAVEFKRAGVETGAQQRLKDVPPPPPSPPVVEPEPEAKAPEETPKDKPEPASAGAGAPPKSPAPLEKAKSGPAGDKAGKKKSVNPLVIGGSALALAVVGIGGWVMSGSDEAEPDTAMVGAEEVEAVDIGGATEIAGAVSSLADDARKARAPAAAVKILTDAASKLTSLGENLEGLDAAGATEREAEMNSLAQKAAADFSASLLSSAESAARSLARDVPWANPANSGAAAGRSAAQQRLARELRLTLSGLRTASRSTASAQDTGQALTLATQALGRSSSFTSAVARARTMKNAPAATESTAAEETATPAATETAVANASGEAATDAQKRSLAQIIDNGRDIAKRVIRLGDRKKPDNDASQKEKDGHLVRQANVKTAQEYQAYLDTLENSMRGTRTQAEADKLIAQASQTRDYLRTLLSRSESTQ